jgi:RNA polymerase sigma factor (sigma-70 family)
MPAVKNPRLTAEELQGAVERARSGDEQALETVIRAVQDDVFRLALRMTGCPEDARDACQEILVKAVTRLDSYRGESSVRTWVYRIATRHLLDRKKSRVEKLAMSFDRFGADLLDGLATEPADDPLLVEEVKLGCTLAMLICLDRDQRLAYVLADVFDVPHAEAADFCGVTEDTYRQRLSRARRTLEAFTESFCGLVNPRAPCRCDKRVERAIELARIERDRPRFAQRSVVDAQHEIEALHGAAELIRSHPEYRAPADLLEGVRVALRHGARVLS